jgi:hypothetical protein
MDAAGARTYGSIRDASARELATYSKIVLARDVFPVIRLLTFPPPRRHWITYTQQPQLKSAPFFDFHRS